MLPLHSSPASFRIRHSFLLLGILGLFGTGCTTTKQISRDTPNAYSKVTIAAQGETARVRLADGRTIELTNLYVGLDSTSGRTSTGAKRTVPTSAIQEVEFINRGTGFLQGAGLGGGIVLTVGWFNAQMQDSDLNHSFTAQDSDLDRDLAVIESFVLAVPGALIGGLFGADLGQREIYRFSTDAAAPRPSKEETGYHKVQPDTSQHTTDSNAQAGWR